MAGRVQQAGHDGQASRMRRRGVVVKGTRVHRAVLLQQHVAVRVQLFLQRGGARLGRSDVYNQVRFLPVVTR